MLAGWLQQHKNLWQDKSFFFLIRGEESAYLLQMNFALLVASKDMECSELRPGRSSPRERYCGDSYLEDHSQRLEIWWGLVLNTF